MQVLLYYSIVVKSPTNFAVYLGYFVVFFYLLFMLTEPPLMGNHLMADILRLETFDLSVSPP